MITCTDCGGKFNGEDTVTGKRLCKSCNRKRVAASRKKKKVTKVVIAKPRKKKSKKDELVDFGAFTDRKILGDVLRVEFRKALDRANRSIDFQEARLDAAVKLGSPKEIDEASKAIHRASDGHVQLITKLMDKLQMMEDLRKQSEKSKPTTFYLNMLPKNPRINPTREMPKEPE